MTRRLLEYQASVAFSAVAVRWAQSFIARSSALFGGVVSFELRLFV
jgi:hypothetical protein